MISAFSALSLTGGFGASIAAECFGELLDTTPGKLAGKIPALAEEFSDFASEFPCAASGSVVGLGLGRGNHTWRMRSFSRAV